MFFRQLPTHELQLTDTQLGIDFVLRIDDGDYFPGNALFYSLALLSINRLLRAIDTLHDKNDGMFWDGYPISNPWRSYLHLYSLSRLIDAEVSRLESIVLSQICFLSNSTSSSSVLFDATVAQQVRQIEVREPSGLRLWGKKGARWNVIDWLNV